VESVRSVCGRLRIFLESNLREMEERGIEAYVPDPNLARELNNGKIARGVGRMTVSDPHLLRSAQELAKRESRAGTKNARRWSSR